MIFSANILVAASSIIFKLNASQTFCSASDISRIAFQDRRLTGKGMDGLASCRPPLKAWQKHKLLANRPCGADLPETHGRTLPLPAAMDGEEPDPKLAR